MSDVLLSPQDLAKLAPLPKPDRAQALLTGRVGPIRDLGFGGFSPAQAGLAYLIWLARRRARARRGMLSNRPAYEADETLRARVFSAADCSGSVREFGRVLFERLNLSLAALPPRDLLWWGQFQEALKVSERWADLSDRTSLTEVLSAVSLLNELMHQVDKATGATEEEESHAA